MYGCSSISNKSVLFGGGGGGREQASISMTKCPGYHLYIRMGYDDKITEVAKKKESHRGYRVSKRESHSVTQYLTPVQIPRD